MIKLYLFGTPTVYITNEDAPMSDHAPGSPASPVPVRLETRKSLALLAYLGVMRKVYARDELASMLWPEALSKQALGSLRRALWSLQNALGQELFERDRRVVALRSDVVLWVDAAEVLDATDWLAEHRTPTAGRLDQLRSAVALYHNDFMPGFSLADSPQFDDWQSHIGHLLRTRLALALEQLISTALEQADLDTAQAHAVRWLELDRFHEPAHRQLMRIYAWRGQRQQAILAYQRCAELMSQEFGAEPSFETQTLLAAIQNNELAAIDAPVQAVVPLPRRHLPVPGTKLIGRDDELERLARLTAEAASRLITIVGPGGMGKTRLALAHGDAEMTRSRFPDGIIFVPLATVDTPDDLVPAIAAAVGLTLDTGAHQRQPVRAQLLDYLHSRHLLLILDNFEQLLEGSLLLGDILHAAPSVYLLVTSRDRLNLGDEQLFTVGGLPYPENTETPDFALYPAVDLFVRSARRVRHFYQLRVDEYPHVQRICALVDGMPLAIELAAGWIDTLPTSEIAVEVEAALAGDLDFLSTATQDLPPRHRSMSALLGSTWRRLTATQQDALMALAHFRGGFTRAAAKSVAGIGVAVLRDLVGKSLLVRAADDRYAMHELLRHYALGQSVLAGDAHGQLQRAHAHYFAQFLQQQTRTMLGPDFMATFPAVARELSNLQAAWANAVAHADWVVLCALAKGLYHYCEDCAEYQLATELFSAALDHLPDPLTTLDSPGADPSGTDDPHDVDPHDVDPQIVYAWMMGSLGWFLVRQGYSAKSRILLEESVDRLRRLEDAANPELAFALLWYGVSVFAREAYAESELILAESQLLFAKLGDKRGQGVTLSRLGAAVGLQRCHEEAETILHESVRLLSEVGAHNKAALPMIYLGAFALEHGEYEKAGPHLHAAYEILTGLFENEGHATVLGYLGQLALALGDYSAAWDYFSESVAVLDESGAHIYTRRSLSFLGDIARLQGDYPLAAQMLKQALAISRTVNAPQSIAYTLNNLARLAIEQYDFPRADEYLAESLQLTQAHDLKYERVVALRLLGTIKASDGPRRGTSVHASVHASGEEAWLADTALAGLIQGLQGPCADPPGKSGWTQAARCLCVSLQIAVEIENSPLILDALQAIGLYLADGGKLPMDADQIDADDPALFDPALLDQRDDVQRAGEFDRTTRIAWGLLTFVADHPAASFETRVQAQRALPRLQAARPADNLAGSVLPAHKPIIDVARTLLEDHNLPSGENENEDGNEDEL